MPTDLSTRGVLLDFKQGGAQDKILVTTPFIEFYEIILIHFLFLTIFVGDVGLTFFAYQNGGEG